MDTRERERRAATAEEMLASLAAQGVAAVAATFTDTAGITRVKAVPLNRLPHAASWGVGGTPAFDVFGHDDLIALAPDGSTPVGDLRVVPDLDRVVPLATWPGWAWAPADRFAQAGEPHAACSRSVLRRLVGDLAGDGLSVRASFEIEWAISEGEGDEFVPAASGPGYSLQRLGEAAGYTRRLLEALADQGVRVEQLHPEYAPAQFEVSVAAEGPVAAADTSVLVRETVRGVGQEYGYRTSFAPKVDLAGVGNGGPVHLSLTRDGQNAMAGGNGPCGMTADGEAFTAGLLAHLPALMALGAPTLASYLRLVPSHWAGVYAAWGPENREAAIRTITGSRASEAWASNVEVKCFDLAANPYLLLAGLVCAGAAGLDAGLRLPEPIAVDPAVLTAEELGRRGIARLPTSLAESAAAFESDPVLDDSLGAPLHDAVLAVRRMELDAYAGASDEEIVAASRWRH